MRGAGEGGDGIRDGGERSGADGIGVRVRGKRKLWVGIKGEGELEMRVNGE